MFLEEILISLNFNASRKVERVTLQRLEWNLLR